MTLKTKAVTHPLHLQLPSSVFEWVTERAAADKRSRAGTVVLLLQAARFSVELPPDLHERLMERAIKDRRTPEQMAQILLEGALAEPQPRPAPEPAWKPRNGAQHPVAGRPADQVAAALSAIKAVLRQRGQPLQKSSGPLSRLQDLLEASFTSVNTFEDVEDLGAEAWLQGGATPGLLRLLFPDATTVIAQAERQVNEKQSLRRRQLARQTEQDVPVS